MKNLVEIIVSLFGSLVGAYLVLSGDGTNLLIGFGIILFFPLTVKIISELIKYSKPKEIKTYDPINLVIKNE